MSYILDALRKADAQRAEAQEDGADRASLPLSPARPERAEARRRGPWVAAVAVSVGALTLVAGVWLVAPAGSPAINTSAVPVVSTPAKVPVPAFPPQGPMAEAPPAPSLAASMQAPATTGQGTSPPIVEARGGPDVGTRPPAAKPSPLPAVSSVSEEARPSGRQPGHSPGVPARPDGARALPPPLLSQLPPAVRQAVPPITLAGLVSSPQRSARLAIVNGQVMREGDRLTPDLVLEEVRAAEVVFSQRGQRFLVRP